MSLISFHIITITFILALLETRNSYQYKNILFITDKFMKCVFFSLSCSNYTAADWANIFLADVTEHNWGISHQIISDWDFKFLLFF